MANPVTLAKLGISAASNEKVRRALGWVVIAVLSPAILVVALLFAIPSALTQSNHAVVDYVFNGGILPSALKPEHADQITKMRGCLKELDDAMADVDEIMEDGTVDGALVKSVFFCLRFGDDPLTLSKDDAKEFVDNFVKYETRTRAVEVTDPDTGETTIEDEEYTVALAVSKDDAYGNLSSAYLITDELKSRVDEIYGLTAYGSGGSTYSGDIEYGGTKDTALSIAGFTDPSTKNAHDLAVYAVHAWESGWGYVWGTYGKVLTDSLFEYKLQQYPDGVGSYKDFIEENWLGGRTTDCVGLIKGYGWLDPDTLNIGYGTNGMRDVTADGMYKAATVKGSMDTMPDIPGLAVWKSGHIGVYIGGGYVIEAMGTKYGVVRTKLSERNWTAWLEVPYINYE